MHTRWRSTSGQYLPIAMMVATTVILFLGVVANLFMTARAKLEAQNMADAVALAVATLQARCLNVVVDRNLQLNYWDGRYGPTAEVKPFDFPPISKAPTWNPGSEEMAKQYARTANYINQEQDKFIQAYNSFIGASDSGSGNVMGQNTGTTGLKDILDEVQGLKAGGVSVICWNKEGRAPANLESLARRNMDIAAGRLEVDGGGMERLVFEQMEVQLNNPGRRLLSSYMSDVPVSQRKAGWKRLDWFNSPRISVRSGPGGTTQEEIGVGAVVIKQVRGFGLLGGRKNVVAKSYAYIVTKSGDSGIIRRRGTPTDPPPTAFRPTYYVQLGQK